MRFSSGCTAHYLDVETLLVDLRELYSDGD
jgi:hypothetical protein